MRDPGKASGRFFPAADIGSSLATNLACEKRLEIGQPDVIRPSVAADRCPMTALVIRAIDQETANVSGAHLGEGDLLLAAGLGKAHDSANRAGSEAVGYWGLV